MPTLTTTVKVALGERSYPVLIGNGELSRLGRYLTDRGLAQRVLVVANPVVRTHYEETVSEALGEAGISARFCTVAAGERAKKLSTLEAICDTAIEAGLDRRSTLVALGGGVVGDLVGFAAASLYRGVNLVQVPTTLVAMVDSSVGGKTGVNSKLGKNLVGAFWQPKLVVADLDTLLTLPPRELRCGMAEVIKHGCILDAELFDRLEAAFLPEPTGGKYKFAPGVAVKADLVRYSVQRSCELKGAVVAADEREAGQRAWLNFGHTFGHALEAVCGFGKLHHGEAVAVGMVLAARLGALRGELGADLTQRLVRLLQAVGLPTALPRGTDAEEVYRAMYRDKKVRDGQLRLVLLNRLGEARVSSDTPPQMVRDLLLQAGRESADGA